MLKYMLDTNIVICVTKRRPIELLDVFNFYNSYELSIISMYHTSTLRPNSVFRSGQIPLLIMLIPAHLLVHRKMGIISFDYLL